MNCTMACPLNYIDMIPTGMSALMQEQTYTPIVGHRQVGNVTKPIIMQTQAISIDN